MEDEIKNLIKVWITVFTCLTYCYLIPTKIPKGSLRLISILPIIFIFTLLPLNLSFVNLSGNNGFFIAWLANFKLLLLAFDQGPLSPHSSLSLPLFISIACLPIKIKQTPSLKVSQTLVQKPSLNYVIKLLLFALLIHMYNYKHLMHPTILLVLYCFHIYFALDIMLTVAATMAEALLGLELEPPFNEPYLATSLQDFWGKRWNLMVTSILRPSVYNPVRSVLRPWIGQKGAMVGGVGATFVVSGLMHELMFFYMTRTWPTWEVMAFFVLHGMCLVVEILVKKGFKGKWRLHPVVSVPLTAGFVLGTGFWLFFPQLLRNGVDVRGLEEYAVAIQFGKDVGRNIADYWY